MRETTKVNAYPTFSTGVDRAAYLQNSSCHACLFPSNIGQDTAVDSVIFGNSKQSIVVYTTDILNRTTPTKICGAISNTRHLHFTYSNCKEMEIGLKLPEGSIAITKFNNKGITFGIPLAFKNSKSTCNVSQKASKFETKNGSRLFERFSYSSNGLLLCTH